MTDFEINGNKVTHKSIVLREVEFELGRSYTIQEIEFLKANSQDNLMRTKLFNFAELIPIFLADSSFIIQINLTERWYIWPLPVFELADPNFNIWWQTKDFNRVNAGFNLDHNNFRGRAEKLSLRFKWGYNKQIGLAYNKPYINAEKTIGLSISTRYNQRYEVTYGTEDNERKLYAELGESIREEWLNKVDLYYRPGNRFTSYLTLWHNQSQVVDTVLQLEQNYYLGNRNLSYFGASVLLVFDSRDLPSYPLSGWYSSLSISKPGINPGRDYDFDIWSTEFTANYFKPISKLFYWATGVEGGLLSYKQLPYFFQSGFGITGNLRGYELYFIEAQRFIVVQNHLKLGLLQDREFRLPFVKNPSFGRVPIEVFFGAYADLAYSEDDLYRYRNPLDRKLLLGYGLGLDVVTYYDFVFRVEYSSNRFGESEVYLHFKKAI
ncbi:MAG: hypothetical protein ACPF8V_03285 [Luteibaculum sp.]